MFLKVNKSLENSSNTGSDIKEVIFSLLECKCFALEISLCVTYPLRDTLRLIALSPSVPGAPVVLCLR